MNTILEVNRKFCCSATISVHHDIINPSKNYGWVNSQKSFSTNTIFLLLVLVPIGLSLSLYINIHTHDYLNSRT